MAINSLLGVSKGSVSLDLNEVEEIIMKYTEIIVNESKSNLDSDNANASSQLKQSIRPEFEIETTALGIVYKAKIIMEDYWEYVDLGRPAGKAPPVAKIESWISNKEGFRVRGIEKVGDIRERGINKRKAYTLQDIVRGAAFGIAKKIGDHGTKGNHFLSNVLTQELYNNMNKELSKALGRDIAVNIKLAVDNGEFLEDNTKRFSATT